MTKEVNVSIEGFQLGSEEDSIRMNASGTYHFHNTRHYIQYEERSTEGEASTNNTIKLAPNQIELTKKGANSSQMVFELNKLTEAVYQTPYGNLSLEIKTTKITMYETPEKIQVLMEYSLSTNASHLSDNSIRISINSNLNG